MNENWAVRQVSQAALDSSVIDWCTWTLWCPCGSSSRWSSPYKRLYETFQVRLRAHRWPHPYPILPGLPLNEYCLRTMTWKAPGNMSLFSQLLSFPLISLSQNWCSWTHAEFSSDLSLHPGRVRPGLQAWEITVGTHRHLSQSPPMTHSTLTWEGNSIIHEEAAPDFVHLQKRASEESSNFTLMLRVRQAKNKKVSM